MKSQGGESIAATRRFLSAYSWLIGVHFVPNWRLVLLIVVQSGIAALAQAGVIGFVAIVVARIENPATTGFGWIDEILTDQWRSLLFAGGTLAMITCIGAASSYGAAVLSRRLGRRLHEYCGSEVMNRLREIDSIPPGMEIDETLVQRLVTRNGMLLGRTTEVLVSLAEPLLRFLVAVALLVIVDGRLAWVIVPLLLLMAPALHLISRRVKRGAERFYENAAPEMGRHVRLLVMSANGRNLGDGIGASDQAMREDPFYRNYLDEYDGIALANEKVQFLMNATSAIVLGFSLVVAGYLAIGGTLSWPMVIVFLMALWQVQRAAIQCGNRFATLTRFYPFVVQTRQFLGIPKTDERPPPNGELRLRDPDAGMQPLRPGDRVFLVTVVPLDRLRIIGMIDPLSRCVDASATELASGFAFASDRFRPVGATIRNAIDPTGRIDVSGLLQELELEAEISCLPDGLDTSIKPEVWSSLSRVLRTVITLAPATESERPFFMCDALLLGGLRREHRERILAWFDDRIVFVHCSKIDFPREITDRFMVIENDEVLGIGDSKWFDSISASLRIKEAGSAGEAEDEAEIAG